MFFFGNWQAGGEWDDGVWIGFGWKLELVTGFLLLTKLFSTTAAAATLLGLILGGFRRRIDQNYYCVPYYYFVLFEKVVFWLWRFYNTVGSGKLALTFPLSFCLVPMVLRFGFFSSR